MPEPPGTVTDAYSDTEDSLDAYVTCTVDEFKQYVEACKNAGFKNNIDESQEDEVQSFYAENDSNYGLFLDYYDGEMTISLASMEDYSYEQHTVQLNPGDRLFVYTDGVSRQRFCKMSLPRSGSLSGRLPSSMIPR